MKILAAGDFHGDRIKAKKLADLAEKENVDLIILNGDIVEEENVEGIVGHFASKNKRLLLIPGNHETNATMDFLAKVYNAKNLHMSFVNYDGIGIVGVGGANVGLTQLDDEEFFNSIKKGVYYTKNSKTKIWVTHIHPADTKMERFSNFVTGSSGLKQAIDKFQPDLVICGHVHEAEGIEEKIGKTTVLNVGRNGKIINIE